MKKNRRRRRRRRKNKKKNFGQKFHNKKFHCIYHNFCVIIRPANRQHRTTQHKNKMLDYPMS